MFHWWACLSLNIIQFTNISMKNSYVIPCENGEKNVFQEPYTMKDPFFVTGVIIDYVMQCTSSRI